MMLNTRLRLKKKKKVPAMNKPHLIQGHNR